MRNVFTRAPWLAVALAPLMASRDAVASDLDASGAIVFAADASRTYSFETLRENTSSIVSRLEWMSGGSIVAAPFTDSTWRETVTAEGRGLHGERALRIAASDLAGVALRDTALFGSIARSRFEVSMWGRAEGAEPVLVVAYGGAAVGGGVSVGPFHFARVVAVRTGRETSDGWVEYSTGPIDGAVWGHRVGAILLSARYAIDADDQSYASLLEPVLDPSKTPRVSLDPDASALIDAVEIRPAPGAPLAASACTVATAETDCGGRGECFYGHCVDATFVWGPAPPSEMHRREAAERWAWYAAHMQGDRESTRSRSSALVNAASTIAAATTARGFFGALVEGVNGLRDSHTHLGSPPSTETFFEPFTWNLSDGIDACVGLVQNDIAHDSAPSYAVFSTGGRSALSTSLRVGDLITAIDGRPPLEWLAATAARFRNAPPNDPAAEPSAFTVRFASMVTRHANTLSVAHCTATGCGAPSTVPVAEEVYAQVDTRETYSGFSMRCTGRFQNAVSAARSGGFSQVYVAADPTEGVTDVQFDGFTPSIERGNATWATPFTDALARPAVLVDARLGWGGYFRLGKWLFHQIRGRNDASYGLFLPRGTVDEIDPPWLLGERWFGCESPTALEDEACLWSGGNTTSTEQSSTRPSGARIAWLVSHDVSMNDIVPKLLQGRADFRIFGPHPTAGAFGEVSLVPPIMASWAPGAIQVLDARFASTATGAVMAPWASGHGVVPDEIVTQRLSDVLAGRDTILEAARAWLTR